MELQTLQRWVTHLLGSGAEANTARIRQQAVRRFAAWLADPEVDEIDADPFLGMRPPKIDAKVVQALSADDLRLMLKACAGRELHDRRDEAMLRLLLETGMRAGEILALNTFDVDLGRGLAVVRRGKGGKGRTVAFSAVTGAAIDRYLRVRRRHRYASSAALWLTKTGQDRTTYHGLRRALGQRAEAAGVSGFQVHKLRHTFASRWLGAGGSEGGLMAAAGWSSRGMVDRYSRATASERAMEESRRLGLGTCDFYFPRFPRSAVRTVTCPYRHAAPGAKCVGARGRTREANHAERLIEYQKAQAEGQPVVVAYLENAEAAVLSALDHTSEDLEETYTDAAYDHGERIRELLDVIEQKLWSSGGS